MKDFLARLTSRKFLVTVIGLAVLATSDQWTEFTALILGYLTAEGAGDAVERFKSGVSTLDGYVNPTSQNEDDEVDTTSVTTGNMPLFNEEIKEESD